MTTAPTEFDTSTLHNCLEQYFTYTQFRPGQQAIIESVMSGNDTLAVMPTGGGKSLCYQLPALLKKGIVVVISPLISLMQDQVDALKKRGIPAGSIHSGKEIAERKQVFQEMKNSERYILYVSPERVQKEGFHKWFANEQVHLIAIDEAHCISQWGHDFRPDYQKLSFFKKIKSDVPVLALTATATPAVVDDISNQLGMHNPSRHVHGFYRDNLYYQVQTCFNEEDKLLYIKQGLRQFNKGRVIIYCGTRKQTHEVAAELNNEFNHVGYYHAGLDANTREQIQSQFADKEIRILCATNAFGMGIDQPDIRLVIHYQTPATIEALYQEWGRAGRDGQNSTCLLLYSKNDKGLQNFFIKKSDAGNREKNRRYDALDTLVDFAEGAECRHAGILTYFKDANRIERCNHCDACDERSPRKITVEQTTKRKLSKRKVKARTTKTIKTETYSIDAQAREEALKEWRKEYAQENDIAAFMVFSNRTLEELAAYDPENEDELLKVYGIAEQKVREFGEELLEVLDSLR